MLKFAVSAISIPAYSYVTTLPAQSYTTRFPPCIYPIRSPTALKYAQQTVPNSPILLMARPHVSAALRLEHQQYLRRRQRLPGLSGTRRKSALRTLRRRRCSEGTGVHTSHTGPAPPSASRCHGGMAFRGEEKVWPASPLEISQQAPRRQRGEVHFHLPLQLRGHTHISFGGAQGAQGALVFRVVLQARLRQPALPTQYRCGAYRPCVQLVLYRSTCTSSTAGRTRSRTPSRSDI